MYRYVEIFINISILFPHRDICSPFYNIIVLIFYYRKNHFRTLPTTHVNCSLTSTFNASFHATLHLLVFVFVF